MKLSREQEIAVRQILGSRDFITLFRGGAGTGKSFALSEVRRGLLDAGRPVVVVAPQRQQVTDLNQAATNRNQWYVAISRGRKRVLVYTADKVELRRNIERLGDRPLALELNRVMPAVTKRERPRWVRRAQWLIHNLHAARFLARSHATRTARSITHKP